MKFWTSTFVVSLILFFFIHTVVLAGDSDCPPLDSPETTAIKYQLFAAYQTGLDGYQLPCELKCSHNAECASQCRGKAALRLLEGKLKELNARRIASKGGEPCWSYSLTCMEQCRDHGIECMKACGQTQPPKVVGHQNI